MFDQDYVDSATFPAPTIADWFLWVVIPYGFIVSRLLGASSLLG